MKRLTIREIATYVKSALFTYCCLLTMACNKGDDPIAEDEPQPIAMDVYVAGIKKVDGVEKPFYQKNEEEHMLAYSGDVAAVADDIFTSQGDVYVAGYINSDKTFLYKPKIAALWKNGVIQSLEMPASTLASEARALFVSGPDVYVAGRYRKNGGKWIACVWKNGKITDVTDGSNEARLYDIYVLGNDIYLTGYEINDDIGTRGEYWKNGTRYLLENKNDENIVPRQMFVVGDDVHVIGTGYGGDSQKVLYWKNGVQFIFPHKPVSLNYGLAIAISGNNVYVGGTADHQPTVWRNANSLGWNINPDPSVDAELSDMKILKGNIFAAGWKKGDSNSRIMWIWKNGQQYFISGAGGHYTPTSLFVVGR